MLLLIRYAWGDAWIEERGAQFNMAVNGAVTSDMPYMAYRLLRRLQIDRRVNMKSHWKVNNINKMINFRFRKNSSFPKTFQSIEYFVINRLSRSYFTK